jgi:hypothetical protein
MQDRTAQPLCVVPLPCSLLGGMHLWAMPGDRGAQGLPHWCAEAAFPVPHLHMVAVRALPRGMTAAEWFRLKLSLHECGAMQRWHGSRGRRS